MPGGGSTVDVRNPAVAEGMDPARQTKEAMEQTGVKAVIAPARRQGGKYLQRAKYRGSDRD